MTSDQNTKDSSYVGLCYFGQLPSDGQIRPARSSKINPSSNIADLEEIICTNYISVTTYYTANHVKFCHMTVICSHELYNPPSFFARRWPKDMVFLSQNTITDLFRSAAQLDSLGHDL